MVQKWVNLLRGSAQVEVAGAFPERFLNLCAQANVRFWDLRIPEENRFRLRTAVRDVRRLRTAARKAMCELTVLEENGVPVFLRRFRRRYAFLVGLALSLCAVAVLSRFILTVDVQGNETVPTRVILEEMKRQGVYPGAYAPLLDETQIGNDALLNLRDLVWISVNLHGTRAEVLVRERTPKPEVVDESVPAHVVAGASGMITRMEVLSGQALVHPGDTVVEGETLICGVIDLKEPLYSEGDMGTLTVRAAGNVYARTWRTLCAEIPLEADVKEYTGETLERRSLTIFGRRVQFYKNGGISYAGYDKIKTDHTLTLRERRLPLTFTRETVREYRLNRTQIDVQAGGELLRQRLEERLWELLRAGGGEVVSTQFDCVQTDGVLRVTMTAECTEQIGKTEEFQGRVGRGTSAPAVPGS